MTIQTAKLLSTFQVKEWLFRNITYLNVLQSYPNLHLHIWEHSKKNITGHNGKVYMSLTDIDIWDRMKMDLLISNLMCFTLPLMKSCRKICGYYLHQHFFFPFLFCFSNICSAFSSEDKLSYKHQYLHPHKRYWNRDIKVFLQLLCLSDTRTLPTLN